jgi:hypothetical protein
LQKVTVLIKPSSSEVTFYLSEPVTIWNAEIPIYYFSVLCTSTQALGPELIIQVSETVPSHPTIGVT